MAQYLSLCLSALSFRFERGRGTNYHEIVDRIEQFPALHREVIRSDIRLVIEELSRLEYLLDGNANPAHGCIDITPGPVD